ncbi:uncharacterized protein LAESUDRAFT_639482 [Laetiporus sulphureus 93-53]|uniref:Protein kinase domain-containing protein n=1 Tax=Laetiporus sulphureus 93-53 TaxID=1314785 RepID=A0A165III3_9APHY|nr:uncharacterized protein LAESUDRAFT_639482 [Laetiporus sulphureus 93-53]KZT13122.1 hypothetical protein LAESUDRAFT_639482 [Laetiporus sulphureus 93-53]
MSKDSLALRAQELIEEGDEIFSSLSSWETAWADRQMFLESRGYMLRPRYRSGWIPSWKGTGKHPMFFEDSVILPLREHLIDATRMSDGMLVYIKRVRTGDTESRIATMLSSPPLSEDPENHSVPILELFQDADDESISYMVMPFLRLIDEPPFALIEEIMEFVDQILVGLAFLHKHGVAHRRDCEYKNLMMDAHAMYPQGHHPVATMCLPDGMTKASYRSRADAGVKYYFVDFGISVHFPPDVRPKLVVGTDGRDQEVPELSMRTPYDPFKVDMFIIGNVFRHELHDKFSNVEFLVPMIESMTQRDPSCRPSAVEALTQWRNIRGTISSVQLRWRPRPREEEPVLTAFYEAVSLVSTAAHFGKELYKWAAGSQG